MKKHILFIHSAGAQGIHEGSHGLVEYLRGALEPGYEITAPIMPNHENPDFASWKNKIADELNKLNSDLILIGHSLGGSVLLKHLSEEPCKKNFKAIFLVAVPYWGEINWDVNEFMLDKEFASKLPAMRNFIYHSYNDECVPFSHGQRYAQELSNAIFRKLEGTDHEFGTGLPDLLDDIKSLT